MNKAEFFLDRAVTLKGEFTVIFGNAGIYELLFPGKVFMAELDQAKMPWSELANDLDRYLTGQAVNWSEYPLDLSGYGQFTAALLKEVSKIPYGQVCSYREAAERAGSPLAWRAAGQALAANRHPLIVPCHRVIGSNGKVGGFSGPAGWKEMLLKLEGGF